MSEEEKFNLQDLLSSAAKRMRAELSEQLISHRGEKGGAREEVVRRFLRAYLAKRFEISTGFAFDASGAVSKQLDIVITDAFACPRLEAAGGVRFFPCESVLAVGQIRSQVTSRSKFQDALDNLDSVKALDRSADGRAFDTVRQEQIDNKVNYLHQIFTFLMIVEKSLAENTAFDELGDYLVDREPYRWPNLIVAPEKYLMTYSCDDGVCPNTMHATGIAIRKPSEPTELLMRFYLLLGRALEVTRFSSLPHWSYLQDLTTWDADVYHPFTVTSVQFADDRMPHLSDSLGLLKKAERGEDP